jgi:hypothetical protein
MGVFLFALKYHVCYAKTVIKKATKIGANMKSPLALDKETIKKYGITEDIEVSPIVKLSFLQTQLTEIQHAMWRARVDIVHATRLTESKNETLKNKGFQNMADHVNQVQQFTGAIKMLQDFIKELEEEYPELKAE